jgi:hypothetical protein
MTGTEGETRIYVRLLRGYKASWPGLFRIGFWCLLFLWAFGSFIPQPLPESVPSGRALAGTNVIPFQSFPNDSRGVREDVTPHRTKINIAWIADSGSLVTPQGKSLHGKNLETVRAQGGLFFRQDVRYLPLLVAGRLRDKFGLTDFDINLYLELGRRPFTTLLYTLQAIDDKPEAIVISLNPIWMFSSYQFYRIRESLAMAPTLLVSHPDLWQLIPLFVTPSQDLLALLGNRFRILREAPPYKRFLVLGKNYVEARPADFLALNIAAPWILPKALVPLMEKQPPRSLTQSSSKGRAASGNGTLISLKAFPALVDFTAAPTVDTFSLQAFAAMVQALKNSGIPALIYTSPLDDPFYADADSREKLYRIKAYLAVVAKALEGTNVRIIPSLPEDVRKTIGFIPEDGFHQWNQGKLDTYLAGQIQGVLDKHLSTQSKTIGPKLLSPYSHRSSGGAQ